MVEVSARDRPKADGLAMHPEANPGKVYNFKRECKDAPAKATQRTQTMETNIRTRSETINAKQHRQRRIYIYTYTQTYIYTIMYKV